MAVWLFAAQAGAAAVSLLAKERAAEATHGAAQKQAELYAQQAERVLNKFDEQARSIRLSGRKLIGQQLVAYANNGLDTSSGSALAIMEDTHRQINEQVATIQREAKFQSNMALAGADAIRAQARDQRKAQKIQNYSGFIAQSGSAFSDWYKFEFPKPVVTDIPQGEIARPQTSVG